MHLLIDADSISFRAARAATVEIISPRTSWVSVGYRTEHLYSLFEELLGDWVATAKDLLSDPVESFSLCFSDSPNNPIGDGLENFRKGFYPKYKDNRTEGKPAGFYRLLEYAAKEHDAVVLPGLEADDACGILQTLPSLAWSTEYGIPLSTCVVSIDKDLQTVPGLLVNPDKKKVTLISPQAAEEAHMLQTVKGDVTDNYPGLPGYGEATLKKWLKKNELELTWEALQELWQEQTERLLESGRTDVSGILTQARLAKILTAAEWDLEKREVIPWSFPALSI